MPIVYVSEPPAAADLVIVGGGIVGAATAFHASRAGLRPLVLERRPALSTLTTAAAAGGYRLQVESRKELELIGESVELFLHFEDETGQREHDAGLRQHGYLWVTTSDEGVERQRRLVEAQRSWGLTDVQLIADADLRKAFPFLDPQTRQARFRQADGLIDPKGIALGLAAGATTATFVVDCDVVGIDVDGDGVRALRTTKGTIATRSVVLDAGPAAAHRPEHHPRPLREHRLQRTRRDGRTRRLTHPGRRAHGRARSRREPLPPGPRARRAPAPRRSLRPIVGTMDREFELET